MTPANSRLRRDEIIEKARTGDLTPEQAEGEAERLKCGPLAYEPPPGSFDPMPEEFWSLAMAVAWIAYRTPAAVREWWDAYRAECWDWIHRKARLGFDGPIQAGYFLEQRSNASLARLKLAESIEDRSDRDLDFSMAVGEAMVALHIALRGDCLAATGIHPQRSHREPIPAALWQDLDFGQEFGRDIVEAKAGRGSRARFEHVTVQRGSVTLLWPARPVRLKPSLPPLMKPEAAGYMPLYCAAQWIATQGGEVDIDPDDINIWRPAYAALIDFISSGQVAITGVANGSRETIDGAVFAGCQVQYPFETPSMSLMFSKAFYLRSHPFLDEEQWRSGFDDAFENRWEKRWSQLMVQKAAIARLWPFQGLGVGTDEAAIRASYRSGAPGQPSSMYLVEAEFEARCARGEVKASVGLEAEALSVWRKAVHPHSPKLSAKTIKNKIAQRFREYEAARN